MTDDARPGRSAAANASGRHRVEISDQEVDLEPERQRVGRGHRRRRSTVRASGTVRAGPGPDATTTTSGLDHAFLRWHYPGQVQRVGGALAALSARLPELPGSLSPMVARQKTAKPRSPDAASSSTSSRSTRACGGPCSNHETSTATSSAAPSSSASTDPSAALRTHPETPSCSARRRALSRNQTPCTRPRATTR